MLANQTECDLDQLPYPEAPFYEELREKAGRDTHGILDEIVTSEDWLPLRLVRQSFTIAPRLAPIFLAAAYSRSVAEHYADCGMRRVVSFGVPYLGQLRYHHLFPALINLIERHDIDYKDDWLFWRRVLRFGHGMMGAVCPDAQSLIEIALNHKYTPVARYLAFRAMPVLVAEGDITRAESVRILQESFLGVQGVPDRLTIKGWVQVAVRLNQHACENEIQSILASGLLSVEDQSEIQSDLQKDPEELFAWVIRNSVWKDPFRKMFPTGIRQGEIGFKLNQMPC